MFGKSATGAIAGGVAARAALLFAPPTRALALFRRRMQWNHLIDFPPLSASGLNPETQTALTEVIISFGTVSPASTEVPSSSLAPVPSVYHSDDMATIAGLFSIPVLPSSIRLSFSSLTGISTIFVDSSILGSSPSGGLSPIFVGSF
ncbi:hypothetical protein BUALT_Bualt19G0096100 [Buddleja alternifolia]|uniref:Secreted protein n=1 Tax=Buddleja alternifolia TaxID=168488 RepID=A0AAV6WA06_9LAMI|nr:hypothetical protein BUALT_Bualt19G0096100 [Buddleja alternifolia]